MSCCSEVSLLLQQTSYNNKKAAFAAFFVLILGFPLYTGFHFVQLSPV